MELAVGITTFVIFTLAVLGFATILTLFIIKKVKQSREK